MFSASKKIISTLIVSALSLLVSSSSFASSNYEGAIIDTGDALTVELNGHELKSMSEIYAVLEQALGLSSGTIQNLDALEEYIRDPKYTPKQLKVIFTSGEALRITLNEGNKNPQIDRLNDLIDTLNQAVDENINADGFNNLEIIFLQ